MTRRSIIPFINTICRDTYVAIRRVEFIRHFNLSILPAMAFVIFARKLLLPEAAKNGNINPVNPLLNSLLTAMTNAENSLVGRQRIRLPAGPSIVCRLSKGC